MPTGFTQGILTGKINTFPEFAKLCTRAFGAAMHMRDNDLNDEFIERKPSEYNLERIDEYKKKIFELKNISDEDLIKETKKNLKRNKTYNLKIIKERKQLAEKINNLLKNVINWQPPKGDYKNFKNFIIQQLQDTYNYDCKTDYYETQVKLIDEQLKNIKAENIRNDNIKSYEDDINYHEERRY